jgi:hypothetical protein
VTIFTQIGKFLAVLCLLQASLLTIAAQEPAVKPAEKSEEKQKPAEKSIMPFQIQLLETRVRFEANGDYRKEVHTVVKLNNILGAREFARLTFDYNRAFQQLEIPQVRITHANGGTMTSGAIAQRFDCTWQTTSRHLRILEEAALIHASLRGRERIYQLDTSRLATLTTDFVDRFRTA